MAPATIMITVILVKTMLIQQQVFLAALSANRLFTKRQGREGGSHRMASWTPGPADVVGGTHGLWRIPPLRRLGEAPLAPVAFSWRRGSDGKAFHKVTKTRNLSHPPPPAAAVK